MSYLGDFLFAPERARSPVKSLSGGERNRLLLARLFARPANALVLDEPTNDLDVETLELLEGLLTDYAGTIFLVSHDRAFLDNVVTQTIAFEGDGRWREYVGGYADTEAARARAATPAPAPSPAPKSAPKSAPASKSAKPALGHREQRELAALPDRIGELEAEQAPDRGAARRPRAVPVRPRRRRARCGGAPSTSIANWPTRSRAGKRWSRLAAA